MAQPSFRSVAYSQTTLTELMIPSYANFGGKIHGGILLSLMDKVAYACAAKHAGNYCVTVSVEVGELVSLLASVNYVGNTSLMVGIKVISENVKSGFVKHTNTSYFTMVAKGDDDKPTQVPGLILESREDARRFLEAIRRRELSRRYQTELANAKTILQVEDGLHLLQHERCRVAF